MSKVESFSVGNRLKNTANMFNAVSSWWGAIQKKDSDGGGAPATEEPAAAKEGGKEDTQHPESSNGTTTAATSGSTTTSPGTAGATASATTTTTTTTQQPGGTIGVPPVAAGGGSSGDESPVTESASEHSGSETAAPSIPPLPGKKKRRQGGGASSDELLTSSDDEDAEGPDGVDEKIEAAKQAIEDVSTKAVTAAKEWGSYLFNVGKSAGRTVADTASKIKNTVEEKTLLGEFTREQEKFVNENKEKGKHAEAAVPPWIGYNEEETMKKQILALSADKRNFLRNPPGGVQFSFDFDNVYPIAMATLQEDPELQKMRFELVPKQINEENFWRNYFYRVSLIKQSTQLTSIAKSTGSTGENQSNGSSRRSSAGSECKERSSLPPLPPPPQSSLPQTASAPTQKDEDLPLESPPPDNEFISDTFASNQIDDEDLRKEMQQLSVKNNEPSKTEAEAEDLPQWEKELQKELQEYDMVDDSVTADDIDLEKEILQQLEQETKSA